MPDPDVQFATLGCRLNAYESEVMRQHAEAAGAHKIVVVNTCAVTQEAQRKSRQTVRRLRRRHPDARLIVTGCAAQINPTAYAALPGVDVVLGNSRKLQADSWQALVRNEGKTPAEQTTVLVDDIMAPGLPAEQTLFSFGAQRIAYVQVQSGCDHRCTFCIIPYGRGNAASIPAHAIIDQIRILVEQGYREVVLTGVDMTSWGADLEGRPRLGHLIARILKLVPDLSRLRLSSIDPAELDDTLLATLASEDRLMPHLHLSVQSGDDMVLKRMKRRHRRSDVLRLCKHILERRSDVVFGADFITGFPTETDAMHERTVDLIRQCPISWLHVFPYSPHTGTPAARMPQIDGAAIRARAADLRQVGMEQRQALFSRMQGEVVEVLLDSATKGRIGNYARLELDAAPTDSIVAARVTGATRDHLLGTIVC